MTAEAASGLLGREPGHMVQAAINGVNLPAGRGKSETVLRLVGSGGLC